MRPPKEVGPGADYAKANQPNTRQGIRTCKSNGFDDLVARRRRRAAAVRSTVTGLCSCIRDPDVDVHRCGDEITDKMADAAVTAAKHLELLGTPGLFDADTCWAMWRRGHRMFASQCFSYSHGEAA